MAPRNSGYASRIMKTILICICLVFAAALPALAQDNTFKIGLILPMTGQQDRKSVV